jgi:hypothetical protein
MKVFLILTVIFLSIFDFKYWIKPDSTENMCVEPVNTVYLHTCPYL